jgi:hypothetical protein
MHAVKAIKNPDERYQNTIVAGRAMMYRIRCVKLSNKNKLPKNPHIKEATLIQ